MDELVDARDVLDANARIHRPFRARILGHYRRTGPNSWDPYRFVAEPGGEIQVLPGLKVHVESEGVVFRMRAGGAVLRVEWLPTDVEQIGLGPSLRERFMKTCVTHFHHPPGQGLTAVIARKLEI